MSPQTPYKGRFAPSPTGPLHAGSLLAALASWLDARAHGGTWLVRIEDVDTPRTVAGAARHILQQLSACGLQADETRTMQSQRTALYQQALRQLAGQRLVYPCHCTRKDISCRLAMLGLVRTRHGELVYPGTCRPALNDPANCLMSADDTSTPCAWRLRTNIYIENRPPAHVEYREIATYSVADQTIQWHDRRLGEQHQNVTTEVGDFVLKRADGCFTYQLAVVVDDAAQGITHVVRGMDLADNTARQVLLQRALGLPTPQYLHTPLVLGTNGEKLSKQNGALALDTSTPQAALAALGHAAHALGLPGSPHDSITAALTEWTTAWRGTL
jgi:glutamyl-Q tRNA(Asp) synthetase